MDAQEQRRLLEMEAAVQTAGFEFWIDQKEVDTKNKP